MDMHRAVRANINMVISLVSNGLLVMIAKLQRVAASLQLPGNFAVGCVESMAQWERL